MDRKRGAGLITGNESPNGNKKDILDMMGGIQTDVTIRNDDLSVE